MSSSVVTLRADYARRIPDPVFRDKSMERHIFFVRAKDLPAGIPREADPRRQDIQRKIYLEIAKHLREEEGTPGTFHLKNKGITILANRAQEKSKGVYELTIESHQGIVDGAHTYDIITENLAECPEDQYVRVEVLTGIDAELVVEIAEGLNTAMQVQPMSLASLSGKFDWLKDALNPAMARTVAFMENEKEREVDVRDIVALLTLFNVELYPADGPEYPIKAYTSKSATLDDYLEDLKKGQSFLKMKGIVNDVLTLHDLVHLETRVLYNREEGGRAGKFAFMRSRKRGLFKLPFTGQTTKFMLFDGPLYPMLGAFRWMVCIDPKSKEMRWKPPTGFSGVRRVLELVGASMMRSTNDKSVALSRNPNAIGKDRGHWENLLKTVALAELQGL